MATEKVLSLISEVRGGFIRFLESELAASSANEVQPSYGPVLSALFKHDGKLKMKEIAHAANRDKSTVTYLVNNLVKIGYVKKEPGRQDCRQDGRHGRHRPGRPGFHRRIRPPGGPADPGRLGQIADQRRNH